MEETPQLTLDNTEIIVAPACLRASIIIVGYNSRHHLERCLSGVLASAAQGDEIIVVDNASRDESGEWVQDHYPEIHLIRSPVNLGFGGANNLAAQRAGGKFLVFLNPDTLVEPGWLEALVKALETNPDAGLATSRILLLDSPGRINTCGNDIHISGLTLCRGMGAQSHAFPVLERVAAVSGAAFAIRKDLFDCLGGFDERFFLYMEDTDISLRARLAGYSCLYVPSSLVHHDYRLTFGPLKTYYQERNRYIMLLKCLRWRTLLVLSPVLFLTEIATWGFVLACDRPNWRNKLRAYAWVSQKWGEVASDRRSVQLTRQIPDSALLQMTSYRLDFEQIGEGTAARAASWVFNPLFRVLRQMALSVVKGYG